MNLKVNSIIRAYSTIKSKSYQKSHNVRENHERINHLTKEQKEIIDSINYQVDNKEIPLSKKKCPECGKHFSLLNIKGIDIECCTFCNSLWFDSGELKEITHEYKDVPADNLIHRK